MSKILDKIKGFGHSLTGMFKERDDGEYISWLDPDSDEGKALLNNTKKALNGELESEGELDAESKRTLLQAQQEVNKLERKLINSDSKKDKKATDSISKAKVNNQVETINQEEVVSTDSPIAKTKGAHKPVDKDRDEI